MSGNYVIFSGLEAFIDAIAAFLSNSMSPHSLPNEIPSTQPRSEGIASASLIRSMIEDGKDISPYVPKETAEIAKEYEEKELLAYQTQKRLWDRTPER